MGVGGMELQSGERQGGEPAQKLWAPTLHSSLLTDPLGQALGCLEWGLFLSLERGACCPGLLGLPHLCLSDSSTEVLAPVLFCPGSSRSKLSTTSPDPSF